MVVGEKRSTCCVPSEFLNSISADMGEIDLFIQEAEGTTDQTAVYDDFLKPTSVLRWDSPD